MNASIPPDKLEQIKEDLFHGRKIDAIKLYREYTNVGLAEAKQAVEKIEAELGSSTPGKSAPPVKGKGCLAVLVLMILFAAGVSAWAVR